MVSNSYVWGLVFLRSGFSDSYVWGLVLLRLGVTKLLRLEVSFLAFWGHRFFCWVVSFLTFAG